MYTNVMSRSEFEPFAKIGHEAASLSVLSGSLLNGCAAEKSEEIGIMHRLQNEQNDER